MEMETSNSVYSLTPTQAGLNQFYDLHLAALTSRKYHGAKFGRLRLLNAWLEGLTALTSSTAVASLVFWGFAGGIYFYGALTAVAAIAAVWRTSSRMSERLDRHSRLSTAWSEIFLDMDRMLGAIRQDGGLNDTRRLQVEDLIIRFHRTELLDDPQPDSRLHERMHGEALQALPVERRWLPQT